MGTLSTANIHASLGIHHIIHLKQMAMVYFFRSVLVEQQMLETLRACGCRVVYCGTENAPYVIAKVGSQSVFSQSLNTQLPCSDGTCHNLTEGCQVYSLV